MKKVSEPGYLFAALVLVLAAWLSPSNEVDDAYALTSALHAQKTFIILTASSLLFLIYQITARSK